MQQSSYQSIQNLSNPTNSHLQTKGLIICSRMQSKQPSALQAIGYIGQNSQIDIWLPKELQKDLWRPPNRCARRKCFYRVLKSCASQS